MSILWATLHFCNREPQNEDASLSLLAGHFNGTPMVFDDFMGESHPKTHPLVFRGEEGVKEVFRRLLIHPHSGVSERNFDHGVRSVLR